MNASPERELAHEYFKNFGLLLICGLSVSNWLIKFDEQTKNGGQILSLGRQLRWTWEVLEKDLHLWAEGREAGRRFQKGLNCMWGLGHLCGPERRCWCWMIKCPSIERSELEKNWPHTNKRLIIIDNCFPGRVKLSILSEMFVLSFLFAFHRAPLTVPPAKALGRETNGGTLL